MQETKLAQGLFWDDGIDDLWGQNKTWRVAGLGRSIFTATMKVPAEYLPNLVTNNTVENV